jgi:hypothetical protein
MSWIAVAVGGSALVGGISSMVASGQQAGAAQNAQNISQSEFNTITGQEQPYMEAGYGAQSQLNYLLGIGQPGTSASGPTAGTPAYGWPGTSSYHPAVPASSGTPGTASSSGAGGYGSLLTPFNAQYMQQYSPAYQFQMQQGQQGVLNQDAASQGALSGASMKDLIGFNQNYANTAFNNAFNQYQTQQGNVYQRLAGVSQLGQAAAANTGQQGTALAGQAAQSATNIGTAQAGGTIGVANAASSASSLPWLLSMSQGANQGAAYGTQV